MQLQAHRVRGNMLDNKKNIPWPKTWIINKGNFKFEVIF